MEMERRQTMVTKKVWKTIRIMLFMLTKGIACKSKLIAELLKRAKLAAAEAISNTLTLHHHSASISPRDYEFSCSNSPAVFPKFRNNKHHHHRHHQHQHKYDDFLKVLEILNNNRNESEKDNYSSPSPMVTLPGFGKSPIERKLIRITDSPFPPKADEGDYDGHVDVAAEEFIKRFYKQLNLQRNLVSIQSPSPYHNYSWDR